MRSPLALVGAAILTVPAAAQINPISQNRSVAAAYSFSSATGSNSDSDSIAASDFGPFLAEIEFEDVHATQHSGVNPGGFAGIYGSGFVSTVGTQDDFSEYRSNATSSFELAFALGAPMSLAGAIGATFNGGGEGFAEIDVFVMLSREGGSTETWRIMTSTGDVLSESLAFSTDLVPGNYTLSARAHNNNVPFNAFGFFPAQSSSTFSFQMGVPAPGSLAVCAAAALFARRRSRA